MYNFEFVKPASIAEATAALESDGAQALSGGQTLLPTMKQRLAGPGVLGRLPGLAAMRGGFLWGVGERGGRRRGSGGAQPWHHRRLGRQQRSGGLLSVGGAGLGRDGGDKPPPHCCRRVLPRSVHHGAGGG